MADDDAGGLLARGAPEQAPPGLLLFLGRDVNGVDGEGPRRQTGRRRSADPVGRTLRGTFALLPIDPRKSVLRRSGDRPR